MSGAALHVMIPNFPSPDGFVDNVAHCLRQMGHRVTCAPRRFGRSGNPRIGRCAEGNTPYIPCDLDSGRALGVVNGPHP